MKNLILITMAVCCCMPGCFPIGVDVDEKGQVLIARQEGFFVYQPSTAEVTKLRGPGDGQPAFAQFSPSGSNILLVTKGRNPEQFIDDFRFDLMSVATGKTQTIYRTKDAGNAKFAPDGKRIAIIRYVMNEQFRHEPELQLLDVKTKESRILLKNAGPFLNWFSDSKRLIVFQSDRKDGSEIHGQFVLVDADNGRTTPLAAAIALRESSFDLSPDNQKLVFTANNAGAAGAQLAGDQTLKTYLFELNVPTRRIRRLGNEVQFVRYSPNGKRILMTQEFGIGFSTKQQLVVADAELTQFQPIANDAFTPIIAMLPSQVSYPGWIGNVQIYYFTERMVYGTAGKALHMVVTEADGKNRWYVQPKIDIGVEKAK